MTLKKLYTTIFVLSLSLIYFGCSSSKDEKNVSTNKSSYKEAALKKYKNNINYQFSPDSNYVVCYRTETKTEANGVPQLRFFIYNLKYNEVSYEDNFRTESFSWLDNNKIKVMKRPGMITVDPKKNIKLMGYIYDLSQNKKLPLQIELNK